jgi:hypothetical protein
VSEKCTPKIEPENGGSMFLRNGGKFLPFLQHYNPYILFFFDPTVKTSTVTEVTELN